MKTAMENALNQSKKHPSIIAMGALAMWILLSMIIADQVLTAQVEAQVDIESVALEKQADTVTEAVRQNLKQMHGIAHVAAHDDVVLMALAKHDVDSIPVAMSAEQRKNIWVKDPRLLASSKQLAEIAEALSAEAVYVMDAGGNCIASSNFEKSDTFIGANFAQRDYFKMASNGKSGYQYAVGKVSNIPGLYFSFPVVRDGRIIGVVAAKLNVQNLSYWINQSEAFVSDKYGIIILAGDKTLEMRALPGSSISALSEAERLARYRRSDFIRIEVGQWQNPALPQLKYFAHENMPLLVSNRHIDGEDIGIHVEKHLPAVVNFARDRIRLFFILVLLGIAIIAGIRFRILFAGKRDALKVVQREALERLYQLVDRVPGMVYEYKLRPDGSSCFPFASEAIRDIYRLSPEEVRDDASKVFAILHPDDAAGMLASIQASAHGLTVWRYEYRVRFEEGVEHWMLGNALPERQEDGSVLWHGFITEITEQKNIETELRLKDFALNATANAVVITDADGCVEWGNKAFTALSGYTLSEARGELLDELDRSGTVVRETLKQVIASREIWIGEHLNRDKEGSLYWEEMSIAPVVSDNDEVTHCVVTKQDISERKAMERDLRKAKEEMQRLLDTMTEGAYAVDALGNCIFVNRAFLEMLGYADASEVIGRKIHDLIHHAHADGRPYPSEECQITLVRETRQSVNVANEVFWRKDSTALPVEYWARPMVMDGVVVGVMATFIDITQRMLAQQEQIRMSEQLLSQNRLLMDYQEHIKEEEATARDFIRQFSALDKINDPLVQFMLKPAENFSGDMIAFARTPDNRLHVLLADSAGHGLTAALAVIPITQPFYQMTAKGFDIPAIAQEMNRRVRDYLPLPRYVACMLLSLDTEAQTIQVWNGGCPAVLMLSQDGETVLHRFQSKHLPMGVVKPENFNALVEHLNYESGPSQLLICTDGATEMMSAQSGGDGYDELLSKFKQSQKENLFDGLVEVLGREIIDKEQLDDIAMVVLQCPSEDENPSMDQNISSFENDFQREFIPSGYEQRGEPLWECQITLTASQLKRLDVVPFLVSVTSQIDGEKTNSKVFLVLSELFNNALDHGVLKLSSALKHQAEDMEAYYDEREKRMEKLVQGKVEMHLEKFRSDAGYLMKIHFKDSGEGFDFAALEKISYSNAQKYRHGRGIPLLEGICNALQYLGNGSEVIAYLELPVP